MKLQPHLSLCCHLSVNRGRQPCVGTGTESPCGCRWGAQPPHVARRKTPGCLLVVSFAPKTLGLRLELAGLRRFFYWLQISAQLAQESLSRFCVGDLSLNWQRRNHKPFFLPPYMLNGAWSFPWRSQEKPRARSGCGHPKGSDLLETGTGRMASDGLRAPQWPHPSTWTPCECVP